MTLLKERMTAAGVDASQARLAALAWEALKANNGAIEGAIERLFRELANNPQVVKEALLRPYLIERQRDMRNGTTPNPEPPRRDLDGSRHRTQLAPDPARTQRVAAIVNKAVNVILFKHMTANGRDWATVGAHELVGMDRDGRMARAVEARIGRLSNSDRFKPIGELMTRTTFNEVRASLEAQP